MKNSILLFLFCMILFTLPAQDNKKVDVPDNVKSSMAGMFPQLNVPGAYVKWEKDGIYYKLTTKGYKESYQYAWADSNGFMRKFEEQVQLNILPKKAIDNLMEKYPGAEITEAYRIREAIPKVPTAKVSYRINAIIKPTVFFNKDGEIIPKPQ